MKRHNHQATNAREVTEHASKQSWLAERMTYLHRLRCKYRRQWNALPGDAIRARLDTIELAIQIMQGNATVENTDGPN